jgi:hypothetical protein
MVPQWQTNTCLPLWINIQWDKADILANIRAVALEVDTTNHTRTSIIKSTIRSIKHRYADTLKHTDLAL